MSAFQRRRQAERVGGGRDGGSSTAQDYGNFLWAADPALAAAPPYGDQYGGQRVAPAAAAFLPARAPLRSLRHRSEVDEAADGPWAPSSRSIGAFCDVSTRGHPRAGGGGGGGGMLPPLAGPQAPPPTWQSLSHKQPSDATPGFLPPIAGAYSPAAYSEAYPTFDQNYYTQPQPAYNSQVNNYQPVTSYGYQQQAAPAAPDYGQYAAYPPSNVRYDSASQYQAAAPAPPPTYGQPAPPSYYRPYQQRA